MTETRIKISSLIENQLPQFVKEEFPLVSEFLSQYYISLENQSATNDLLENIDKYVKVDNLTNLIESTELTSDVTFFDSTINVTSTAGFPDSYGLLLIDSEIITYKSKTSTSFDECVRGFSGITSYEIKDELTFKKTQSEEHESRSIVTNLSILFLKQFFNKVKKQITPGFENRDLYVDLNERLFVKQSIDFYSSKGTDSSFKILFGALYGQNVDVIRPRDYLIQPSDAQYRITSDLVVESIEGNPEDLINGTLYQDKTLFIDAAQGTITKVEKIKRNAKDYYTISLDSDYNKDIEPIGTIFGEFAIHPKTKTVASIISKSPTIEVDSTVGFPIENGSLVVNLENGTTLDISYKTKTLNQFLGCSGISQNIPANTEIKSNFYAYGYSPNGVVKIRILGVLSELEYPTSACLYSKEDSIKIKTLGINLTDLKSNNWFLNVPVKYTIKSVQLLDTSDKSYKIDVFNNHSFRIGDFVTVSSSGGFEQTGYVVAFNNEKSFSIQFGSKKSLLDLDLPYTVLKNISKVESLNYPSVNQYTSNVQNIYSDNDKNLYVTSPSLPTYLNRPLTIRDRSITFSGTFSGTILEIGQHGFYTGDSIVYKPTPNNNLGISTGVYFIKKITDTQIKLARSRSNIFTENFVEVNGTVSNNKFELSDFTFRDLNTQLLESQKLIRKITNPNGNDGTHITEPGLTGLFVNGVELLNYKSKDDVYYGPIKKIIPTANGSGYDIINPPDLHITDPIGFGASAYCSVNGGLERIDILDPGFDYIEEPVVEIIGGNGYGAVAKANLVSFDHEVIFNSQATSQSVSLTPTNTIEFSTYHKFRNCEEVVYVPNSQTCVGGLSTNSTYFVSTESAYKIKLYKSVSDAASGINTIQLTSYGSGNHIFKSKNKKQKIKSITIKNSGKNYQNRLVLVDRTGISTESNIINISNHGYESGEIIVYNATEVPIGGLSSATSYYITKINDNKFKLSQVGVSSLGITTSFYYDSKQYINITTTGSGIHKFNYPEIKVTVNGRIGVSTFVGQDFRAILQPIFKGQIQSVFVQSGGTNYGSEDIINYNRQPTFELLSGSGVELSPIISDGKIVNVLVQNTGSGYKSLPDIRIEGSGFGAILVPVVSDGSIIEIKVIHGGIGYKKEDTFITAVPSGSGAKFEAEIQSWKINLVERLIGSEQITDDDGILSSGLNNKYGLQYTHAYAPRNLRSSVQATFFKEGKTVYIPDLQLFDNKEVTSSAHSPIIGWAYDGNPIYGPYGYTSSLGGAVKCLQSGYKIGENSQNRPSTSIYPVGFFVEDYEYGGNGDLDEHNGRFGITPEYPNGVYAYFTTVNPSSLESAGKFNNFKRPIFPYVIGNTYKSNPIEFNFDNKSNQDDININETGWRRNTTPYNILKESGAYNYFLDPNTIQPQNSIVESITKGSINFIDIISKGTDYKVGDRLKFDNKTGYNAKAKVSLIEGKNVSNISLATSSFDNVEFYPYNQEFLGFTTVPHNYLNNDLITITGKYDYKKSGYIGVNENKLTLTSGIGSTKYTGIVTYFSVSGNLNFPNIKENDLYQIGNEEIKVLNIDKDSSRIRVIRNQNNTSGLTTYAAGTLLTEKTKKFKVNFGISTSYSFNINRQIYFDPIESVGLGTTGGVGILSTIYISNPGVGITQILIPTQTIYLKNHNLNTGDSLIYSSNGGTRISVSTNGYSSFQLNENSIVYAARISNDLIGISTVRVGLGSTGTFVSFGSTISGLLYFTSIGTGTTHSFKTNYSNLLSGQINKNVVTVSTAETHGLSLLDKVNIKVTSGISTTFIVKYNDYNRRLIINPRSFSSIDVKNDIIIIQNHGYYNGQKVLYTSDTPASGLVNQKLYYVIVIDSNKIKLSTSYYGATKPNPDIIDISSSTAGTISPINPPLQLIKNQSLTFDLSDSSLSFIENTIPYSAFDFKLYKNNRFVDEFTTTESSPIFEVSRIGRIGIDSTAKVVLNVNENIPDILYYNLIPINLTINLETKKQIFTDTDVFGFNKIVLKESSYNGTHTIIGISSTSFNYNILDLPEVDSYDSGIKYSTSSRSSKGPIEKITIINGGRDYTTLPGITSVISEKGKDAILIPQTNNIGKITSIEIQDIGFDYSADYSIRPSVKLPDILVLDSLSTFDYIGITSFGRNYYTIPSLVVIDSLTNKVISDINLAYNFGDSRVTILKNSTSISNVTPKIIPTNNSNGIKIKNIVFNNTTKDVIVTLGASFSDVEDFPFFVGEKVLIEGISIGIATTGKGYNSINYEYSTFTITSVDPKIGGIGGTVSYNLSSYLNDGEIPGNFNSFYSSGRIIPESHFPIFEPVLKKKDFYRGEFVYTENSNGNVESWDSNNQYLKVSTVDDFQTGQVVRGKTSDASGVIKKIISFDSDYKVRSSSKLRKGWNTETGFLNNDFQRVHDSDYYQYFSYALKSNTDFNTWNDAVSSLNHTSGFKKFNNLLIESRPINLGISTNQNKGDFTGIADLSNVVSLNCFYDFDLAKENNLNLDGTIKSDEIIFNSKIIQDYIESIGNRVLQIDDLSEQFNSNPRPTEFSVVDSFLLDDFRSKKYIAIVQDKRFVDDKQITLISLVHNDSFGFITQYGSQTLLNLGSFDFSIFGNTGNLLFYPVKTKINDYYVQLFSFSLENIAKESTSLVSTGIGTFSLGDSANVGISTLKIQQGTSTPTTIVGIASTYRSAKVLVQIGATDSSYYEYDEIILIHDGTDVTLLEYGQVSTNSFTSQEYQGIGSYTASISGSSINLDLIPYNSTDKDYLVSTINVALGDTNASSIAEQAIGGSLVLTNSTSISSSPTPTANIISSYSNLSYNSSYSIISIEDKTNLQYQVSEFLTLSNNSESDSECYITEFAVLQTGNPIGIITGGISGSTTNIYFTPNQDIDVDVKVFQVNVGLSAQNSEFSLESGSFNFNYGEYLGTNNNIKKDFFLTHKNIPIFKRDFDGSNPLVVNLENNSIQIPNHFYVTGEKIVYSYPGDKTTRSIGIATTSISGIGITNKLPSTLYVVKLDDLNIRVAASASDALRSIPNVLQLTSVGIETSHSFTSTNQNKKILVSIDNLIQSPVVSSSITTKLSKNLGFFDSEVYVTGIGSIFGGDLIKIDNEIMKVAAVGVGSTNSISVLRPWLGTGISTYTSSTTVTKVTGNYNIVGNRIYFSEAPFGKVPILNPSNRPDEVDYVGIETSSSFSGRVFLRSSESDTIYEPYEKNYIFDDISVNFDGNKKSFILKNEGSNITGISTDNAIILINSIFQTPKVGNNYIMDENAGITSITFLGNEVSQNYDVNTASVPRGGIIISVASSQGFGYQPLVAAGGTAIVSTSGTIQSISIGNSGSGYRPGIQQIVKVGIKTSSTGTPNVEYVGIASISNGYIVGVAITNPGFGYTSSNPPIVVFDAPLSYSNIPLIYSSISGVGTGAVVDIVVGQGSSVISFELKNSGYGYKRSETLTVSVGGTTGIPINTSLSFTQFEISVEEVQYDKFTGWAIGNLQIIDPLDDLFDNNRKVFPILIDGNQTTIRSRRGSNIDVQSTLLIFINDVLQVPGDSYIFNGGSTIRFTQAPREGDKSRILFYKGTGDVDTQTVDILETIKVGDNVTLNSDDVNLKETERLVTEIVSSDSANTNLYPGPGITQNENLARSLTWCKQTEDLFLNGQVVGKNRLSYEPYIQPTTNIIQTVGSASSFIFVESVKSFFDSEREYIHNGTTEKPQNKIIIISQDSLENAYANAVVSISGTITSFSITSGGVGYSTTPMISLSNPIGIGTSGRAEAIASITNGSVSSISVTSPGFGYTSSEPPIVLIGTPSPKYEVIDKVSYEGDYGIITGINTTSVGIASTGIIFDFYIPQNSTIRDSKIVTVGIATTGISGIQTGYYFLVRNSNIGKGVTSLDTSGNIISIGTTFIDNIYQVAAVSIAQTSVPGIGFTYVAKVTVSVSSYSNLTGIGFSNFYGEYSWGRISVPVRTNPKDFVSYTNVEGISSSPIIQRFNRLKYIGYSTT